MHSFYYFAKILIKAILPPMKHMLRPTHSFPCHISSFLSLAPALFFHYCFHLIFSSFFFVLQTENHLQRDVRFKLNVLTPRDT